MNIWVPSNSYVEALTPSVAAFGGGASMEVSAVKWADKGGTLIQMN